MFNEEQLTNISRNIEFLGKIFKENQKDIAEAIGVCPSTINNYIKRKSPPNRENLSKIANHFNISENKLINSDLSILSELEDSIYPSLGFSLKNLHILFPIIKLNNEIEDRDFETATKLHKLFYESFVRVKDLDLAKIIELYFSSYEKYKNLDSYANIATLLLILRIPTKDEIKDYLDIYNPFDEKELELITKDCILMRFDEILIEEEKYRPESTEQDNILNAIDIIIDKLAENEKYKEFIYYFISLRYILGVGVITKELSAELCNLIGTEMLKNLVITKNKYALNYIEKLSEFLKFK